MTHPYEINQHTPPEKVCPPKNETIKKCQILVVNDTDRLFEIAQRYRIDLLTSCGAEGMAVVLQQRKQENAEARIPNYIQTTMVPCAGYQV